MLDFKVYTNNKGERILYIGKPNLEILEEVSHGSGDVWHSSFEQGFKNCFQDLIYQTATYWWFLNDFDDEDTCVSWRLNPSSFAVRESVWKHLNGFDPQFQSILMSGLDFGYNLLRNNFGIPLYVKGLFEDDQKQKIEISKRDRYVFYFKNFKSHHAYYMLWRKGIFRFPSEYAALRYAKKHAKKQSAKFVIAKELQEMKGKPTVSLVIPTMKRQEFSQLLLEDHKKQTYLIKEAVIVDATPEAERDEKYYRQEDFPFDIKVKWQTSKGSCRARNEAMELCSGDYILFADDDIRIEPDFVENHIRFLQTYGAEAANGLDIMATDVTQDQTHLRERLKELGDQRWRAGISPMFSNANSFVKREVVEKLIGNDINFDGGYGEDSDFGLRILKQGHILLHNPYSVNLHLKPPKGGYRWWGAEAKKKGKQRKKQPWELDKPVKNLRPIPSPTISYGIIKHFKKEQLKEWRAKYFFTFLFKGDKKTLLLRILALPKRQIQFSKSVKYAKALLNLGPRYK